ncbi:MAG: decaprenyl-phosphate phosphoribosyltransferase [Phycisphaerae bacterium]|nr:decaprenyl-phosphate phosphoribosyltransferase [Phycisphaerae bacterium]
MHETIRLLRPPEWVKNIFVFAALFFGAKRGEPDAVIHAALAFVAFCLASSSGYALNDVLDRDRDRHHPVKKNRPIASGAISPAAGLVISALAIIIAVTIGVALLPHLFWLTVAAYWVLTLFYSLVLKQVVICDVIAIAVLFVIRALAGALAVQVEISPWLIVCTFMLCLFLGFGKRRCEIAMIGDSAGAANHRATLSGYTPELLTHLLSTSAGMAIITFLLYTMDRTTESPFPKHYLVYTIPLVVFAIWRYAMLIETGKLTGPTDIVINDRPFLVTVILWCILATIIALWGNQIENWVAACGPPFTPFAG